MPMFEYVCPQCGHVFEELTRGQDESPRQCPKCAASNAVKILSVCGTLSSSHSSPGRPGMPSTGCAPSSGFS
jgi:putative FmdB family regulatory protein